MIGNQSLNDNTAQVQTMTPAVYADTADGSDVDLAVDPSHSQAFQVVLGAFASGTHTITFEHKDTAAASYTTIDAEDLEGHDENGVQQLAAGGQTFSITDGSRDGTQYLIGYIGGQRFLRVRRVSTGGALYGVAVFKFNLRSAGKSAMRPQWDNTNVVP